MSQIEVVVEASDFEKLRRKPPQPDWLALKPERIQEEINRILPGWRVLPRALGIERLRFFPSPRVARSFATYVIDLADEMGQPCTVTPEGNHIRISLTGRRVANRHGVTQAVIHFAQRID